MWYFYIKYPEMIIFPKAKINIGLRITGKRPDGFHDIETVCYPVSLCDALEFVGSFEPLTEDILTVTGIIPDGKPGDNLVLRAVRKLREKHSFPFLKIHLHKAIPAGAGLGGGSSDASGIIKAINRYYLHYLSTEDLKDFSLSLGSDCPFFIEGLPSFATGRGEILKPVKPILAGYFILLVNPGIGISTREAYFNCHPEKPVASLLELVEIPITKWEKLIINDFENFVFKKHPQIGKIKRALYDSGAIYSSLSGSGSTVYGIFSDKPEVSDKIKDQLIYEGML